MILLLRAILHDEKDYPDPYTFNPDRFIKDGKLNDDVKDPSTAAFGHGRRICPGRFMVFSTLWIAIASMLASFDIGKGVDENGEEIEVGAEYFSGSARYGTPLGPFFFELALTVL
jgi:cytochrome P450